MNDVGKLRGLTPIGPSLDRVWRPPKQRKPGERPKKRNEKFKLKGDEEETEEKALAGIAISIGDTQQSEEKSDPMNDDAENPKKAREHKIDLVI